MKSIPSFFHFIASCAMLYLTIPVVAQDVYTTPVFAAQVIEIPLAPPGNLLKVEYIKAGNGAETLVLLHGFGSSLFSWRNNMQPLAKKFTVYAYNQLGIGASNAPFINTKLAAERPSYTIDRLVEQLHYFLTALRIKQPYLVGNSLGAQIALAYAGRYPHKVAGFILIDPSGGSDASEKFNAIGQRIFKYSDAPYDSGTSAMVRDVLRQVYATGMSGDATVIRAYDELWQNEDYRNTIQYYLFDCRLFKPQTYYQMVKSAAQIESKKKYLHRGLIVWGAEDQWFPVSGIADYAGVLQGADTVQVKNAGHLCHEEKAEEVNAIITKWVQGKSGTLTLRSGDISSLLSNLKSDKWEIVNHSIKALSFLSDDRVIRPLLALLNHSDYSTQDNAAAALETIGSRAGRYLLDAFQDTTIEKNIRQRAAGILGEMKFVPAINPLIAGFAELTHFFTVKIALMKFGSLALPNLLSGLHSNNRRIVNGSSQVLAGITGINISRELIANLSDTSVYTRTYSAMLLGGEKDSAAILPLINALKTEAVDERTQLAAALERITKEKFGQDQTAWKTWWDRRNMK